MLIKYFLCRLWRRHKWEPMEIKWKGETIGINTEFVGCQKCDLWRYANR